MKNVWKRFNRLGWGLMSATFVLQPMVVQAQVAGRIQRSFLNPSFEQPVITTTVGCYVQVLPTTIPGWETTHGSVKAGTGNCAGYVSPGNNPLIEIWTTGFNSVSTATNAGKQFAELNAEQASQLYQNLCLINGETISFSLLHRGRSSATTADVASFLIGTDPTPSKAFGIFSTTNNGTVTVQPVAQNGATIPAVTNNNAGNGWVRYNGTVPYTGTTGNQPVGFAAVSTAAVPVNNTVGNFLDDVQFAGKPVVEFTTSSGSGPEAETTPTTNPPKLRIVGLVPTGGITVPISVSGGTAATPRDFTISNPLNLFIPAGNYDGSDATSLFTIPFTIINNNIPEGVRTIQFTIDNSNTTFITSSTTTCGGTPILNSTYTIYDDDIVRGKVWDDADGSAKNTFTNINTGLEQGTNAGGLNAILVDASNKVIATTPVTADGTYNFANVPINKNNVTILLSTTSGTIGSNPPSSSVPSGWINTSPLTTAAFNIGTTDITGKDFGIEQLPDTDNKTATAQVNPGGSNKVQVPTLSGTDPEDGNIGNGKKFKIVTLPQSTNGILYYDGIAVTIGQIITNYDPIKLTVDPSDGAVTVSFKYAAIDAADQEDPSPATVTIPFKIPGNAKLLLVKRITSIKNTNIPDIVDGRSDVASTDTNYVPAPRDVDDDNIKWPSGYLKGLINAGTVKPGDEIEYTIYFLSDGPANATNVQFCDLVPTNVTFVPTAFNSSTPNDGGLPTANKGIALAVGSITPTVYFSNDPDTDRGIYYPANDTNTPASCGSNTNGAVVVNITNATLTNLPAATSSGNPTNSYGFVRFRGQVK
jgi:uncharacterized repeat protein (TIGR01451 family)